MDMLKYGSVYNHLVHVPLRNRAILKKDGRMSKEVYYERTLRGYAVSQENMQLRAAVKRFMDDDGNEKHLVYYHRRLITMQAGIMPENSLGVETVKSSEPLKVWSKLCCYYFLSSNATILKVVNALANQKKEVVADGIKQADNQITQASRELVEDLKNWNTHEGNKAGTGWMHPLVMAGEWEEELASEEEPLKPGSDDGEESPKETMQEAAEASNAGPQKQTSIGEGFKRGEKTKATKK